VIYTHTLTHTDTSPFAEKTHTTAAYFYYYHYHYHYHYYEVYTVGSDHYPVARWAATEGSASEIKVQSWTVGYDPSSHRKDW
jgi:hypothetical protein